VRPRVLALAALGLALAPLGAGGGEDPPLPTRPPELLLGGVPDVVQTTDYSCGPSALVAVLAYYGVVLTEEEAIEAARTDPDVGAELEHLAAAAEARGVRTRQRRDLGLEDLLGELRAGHPVLVLSQAWRGEDAAGDWADEWDAGHYVVAIGMDREWVYVEDPSLEGARGVIPHAELVARWHGWTIDQTRARGQALLFRARPRPGPDGPTAFERVR